MNDVVRPAALSDAAMIASLESDARSLLVGQRGGPQWLDAEPAWSEIDVARRSATASWHLMIAEIDDVAVGFAAAELGDRSICTVRRLYVDPEARDLGFGELMLEALSVWARLMGASTLESVALPGDRATKNLFERFGMKARLLVVSKRLIDNDAEDAS